MLVIGNHGVAGGSRGSLTGYPGMVPDTVHVDLLRSNVAPTILVGTGHCACPGQPQPVIKNQEATG